MSIQGKKIAMAKHALSVAQSVFENLKTNFNNPFLLEIRLIHIKLQAEVARSAIQSTPAERFNDDGTLKPLNITAQSVVMVTGGVTREEMENGLRKIGERMSDDKCACGNNAEELHTCPYKEDLNGDYETLCNCCEACRRQCCEDI